MSSPTRCFMLEPTHMAMVTLRRYNGNGKCDGPMGYHDANSGIVEVVDATFARQVWDDERQRWVEVRRVTGSVPDFSTGEDWLHVTRDSLERLPHADPRWPAACSCGHEFTLADEWQVQADLMYRRTDLVGDMQHPDLMTLRQAPAGAMWFAWWQAGGAWRPQVGAWPVVVRLPNGRNWMPDTQATNCGRQTPTQHKGATVGDGSDPGYALHHCWVLHGTAPDLTADKQGETCTAGAGSIMSGEGTKDQWHGFLRNGFLTT